jgi:adenylate cyclase
MTTCRHATSRPTSRPTRSRPDGNAYTFAFVDLSGFTALTQIHGDHEAIATVKAFQSHIRAHLGPDGVLVKTIGDAVMLAFGSPRSAIESLTRILSTGAIGSLRARAGAHCGPAVGDGDDFYGHAVNVAARIADKAGGDELLVTCELAIEAQRLGLTVAHVGSTSLRNIAEPIELYRIQLGGHDADLAIDPVCSMRVVTVGDDAIGLRRGSDQWWFCGLPCVAAFASSRKAAP